MDLPHQCLCRQGYIYHKDKLDAKTQRTIIKELTVKPEVLPAFKEFVKPKPYKIFYQDKNNYYLPRYYAEEKFGPAKFTAFAKSKQITPKCHFDPLDFQKEACAKLDDTFQQQKLPRGAGGVLCLPCGYGKTFSALRAVCNLGLKTLVVVNKEFLMDQWVASVKKFTTASVGILQRDRIELDNDIVIAMIHSLCLKEYNPKVFADFGFLVLDEVHHLSSEVFCKALLKVRPPFTLGLSATPERRDGLSHVFHKFIGPIIHKQKRTGANRIIVKQISITSTSSHYQTLYMSNNTKNTAGMATAISQFPARNVLIMKVIEIMIKQGRTILVLSSRRDHLHDLKDMLDESSLRRPDGKKPTYGFYWGKKKGNKAQHRAMLEETAKCDLILGTDAIAKEGLDIPSLNSLIFATPPGMDVEQSVGRILRKYHKDLYPMVVDIVDKTGNFGKHATERVKFYKSEDYDIQKLKISLYDDLALNKYDKGLFEFLNKKIITKKIDFNELKKPKEDPEPDFSQDCVFGANNTIIKPKPKLKIVQRKTVQQIKHEKFNIKKRDGSNVDDDFNSDTCMMIDQSSKKFVKPSIRPAPGRPKQDMDWKNKCLL